MILAPRRERAISDDIYAAVDLGSNSFHLLVARLENEELQVIDRHKEMVRLAGGLDENNNLTQEAQDRALECLHRMGHRLRGIPTENKRVVGTNTLRKARNCAQFIANAEAELGCDIDIISGREEARLLYMGVAHGLPTGEGNRLVCDIGGGSTELIIGADFEPGLRESMHMGCVSLTRLYFSDGQITDRAWRNAVTHARLEFQPNMDNFEAQGWNLVYGASGTFRSVERVLIENDWLSEGISLPALKKLKKALLNQGHIDTLQLDGLSERRQPVFPGGAAIVYALFKTLSSATKARVATTALREGVIYDLAGKQNHDDVRARTIGHLVDRFGLDSAQGRRAARLTASLNKLIKSDYKSDKKRLEILNWAAQLHEIGLSISHAQYHKHGAYILEHADMPGFSIKEQKELGFLVRAQRRKYPAALLNTFSKKQVGKLLPMSIMLRLALLFSRNRTRLDGELMGLSWDAKNQVILLEISPRWLEEFPLYLADLYLEQQSLAKIDVSMVFV